MVSFEETTWYVFSHRVPRECLVVGLQHPEDVSFLCCLATVRMLRSTAQSSPPRAQVSTVVPATMLITLLQEQQSKII